jgi:hypothetical protein
VTGDPRCMRRRTKSPALDKPVLSIGLSLGIYWGVTFKQRVNMGAAMLSIVDELERSGYRCEVVALWRASATNNSDYSKYVNIEYNLKAAVDRWNPAAMAFAIAHPAAQRRLTWRIAETQKQWQNAIDHGYCNHINTADYNRSMAADFDIFFGNMDSDIARQCNTATGAFEMISKVVNDQLKKAKQAVEE